MSFSTLFATEWGYQIGTPESDSEPRIVASPNGDLLVCGRTYGNLYSTNAGGSDIFFERLNSETGNKIIAGKQLGSSENDQCYAIATDSSSNMYIAGCVSGANFGTFLGEFDGFIAKYNSSGTKIWGKQFGSSLDDIVKNMVIDKQGNIYISGYTRGSFGGALIGTIDTFIAKYDNSGNQIWVRKFGASGSTTYPEFAIDLDSDGNIYISGRTDADLFGTNAGSYDVWIVKYSNDGTRIWARQHGSAGSDYPYDLKVDSFGNIYIIGDTVGDFGAINAGSYDLFFAKYDNNGNQIWVKQFGGSDPDYGRAVEIDSFGYIYIGGYSYFEFGGGLGSFDAFVAKYDQNDRLI
ncbi:Beta-propeller repeat protein [Thiovulum sp. ES]|nr:Beta-propeller repeat protein [Thiovulum sp. ES]